MKARDVSETVQDWQARMGETAKKVSDTARNVGHATDEYVHENVWSSIAMAAVVGCVVGYLLGNRGD